MTSAKPKRVSFAGVRPYRAPAAKPVSDCPLCGQPLTKPREHGTGDFQCDGDLDADFSADDLPF